MKTYLKTLIERLSKYGEKLDKIALFAEKKWVLIDDEGNQHSYIFESSGRLIMSLNGRVQIGKWEYLVAAKSILIDRIQDKILLNYGFFDEAIMALKYDGAKNNDFFILADQNKIPDLNIVNYLESKVKKLVQLKKITLPEPSLIIELDNGSKLEIFNDSNNNTYKCGDSVTINGNKPQNGVYFSNIDKTKFTIEDGRILTRHYIHKFKVIDGTYFFVESQNQHIPENGDLIFDHNWFPAKSGKYKLGFMNYLIIEDGCFIKRTFN